MTSTPEINSVGHNKFSPIGAINRSLLTPCRRIGLSRKKKTPNGILNIDADISNTSSDNIICCLPSESTPENTKKSSSIRRNKMNFNSPKENVVVKSKVELDEKIVRDPSSGRIAKKSLIRSLSSDSVNKSPPLREIAVPNSPKNKDLTIIHEELTFNTVTQGKSDEKLLRNENEKGDRALKKSKSKSLREHNSCNSADSPKLKKTKVSHDSDDDFLPSINRNTPKLKRKTSETDLETKSKLSKINSIEIVGSLRDCKIKLHRFSEEEINTIADQHKNTGHYSSDDEVVAKVKKKKTLLDSDDEDSESTALVKDTINSKEPVENEKNISKKLSYLDILQDEDDAFTSSPDKDKNERKELIEKIKLLEGQIKEKKKTLEALKQASVYKSLHNIDDLTNLTEKYKVACVMGLKGLLSQLQAQSSAAHRPIDMPTLLNNLHIPDEVAIKLSIRD